MAEAALPVVCLPGIRGSAALFAPLHAALESHASHAGRALARRLHPLALPPGAPALAASRLLPQLPRGRFHVLAGSFGGLVARFLPADRVASLLCVATLPTPACLDPRLVRRARVALALPDPVLEALYRRHGRRSLHAEGVPPEVVERVCAEPCPAAVLRGRLRGVLSGHHGRVPPVPVAWVRGARDPQVTWAPEVERAAAPQVVSITVPGGHFPHASHPLAFWRAVRDQLAAG